MFIFLSSLTNRNSWRKQGYFPVHKQQTLTKRVTVKPCIFSKLTILLVSYSLKDLWGAVWVGQLESTVPAITPPAPIRSCSQPTPKRRVITDLCSLTLPRSPQSATLSIDDCDDYYTSCAWWSWWASTLAKRSVIYSLHFWYHNKQNVIVRIDVLKTCQTNIY